MTTISCVMIVKDEEKILRRALDSVKDIVDEFMIVDTGSTDGTKDIIREYMNGLCPEIPFVDFVSTKNEALKMASGDYVLWLDADEYIITDNLQKLKKYAEDGTDAVSTQIIEGMGTIVLNTYWRVRLFKNFIGWHFIGPGCHEALYNVGLQERVISDGNVLFRHDHSHRSLESYMGRQQFYIDIIEKYLEKNPYEPRALFYLGRTYKDKGDFLKAIEVYNHYLDVSQWDEERWVAANDIAQCWKMQGEYNYALAACDRASDIDPARAETWTLKGEILYNFQDWPRAVACFQKALSLPVPDKTLLFVDPTAYIEKPADMLSYALDRLHQYTGAIQAGMLVNERVFYQDARLLNNLNLWSMRAHMVIFLCLGKTPENVYGGMMENQGVGGVETTYLELSEHLSNLGHNVFVFCRCDKEHLYRGVKFVPYEYLEDYADTNPDIVITSRWFYPLYQFNSATKKVIWLQDAHFAEPDHPDAFIVADLVVCSSPWHRFYIAERLGPSVPASKIKVIPLAIRKSAFLRPTGPRRTYQAIYSSNPDRGLDQLIEMWPRIVKRVPDIQLAITYGWEGLKSWGDDKDWRKAIEKQKYRMEKWAKKAKNVIFTGRLKKADLYDTMKLSAVCLYPNNFWETFCLTALETMASGTPMITSKLGALSTTLNSDFNILIEGNPDSAQYQNLFVDATVRLFLDNEYRRRMSAGNEKYIFETPCDWSDVVLIWQKILWEIL